MVKKAMPVENGVAWTEEAKTKVMATRPGPAPQLDALEGVIAERRERVRDAGHGGKINLVPKIIAGRTKTAAHLLPLTDAVLR
ncbi:MAG: hypothetical protein QM765_41655 [Myxococcales bacterium]